MHFCRRLIFLCDRLVLKDAYLPPHVYGQLVQKKNGFKLLQRCVSGNIFNNDTFHSQPMKTEVLFLTQLLFERFLSQSNHFCILKLCIFGCFLEP